ncbi:hypothetical protein QEN19_001792 [Hanseniaspora menglaensis]
MSEITEQLGNLSIKEESPAPADAFSLHVGGLDKSVNESILYDLFSPIGLVGSIKICRDTVTGDSLGYAYVNFQNKESAESAIEQLNFTPINGKSCRITWAQKDPSVLRTGAGNIFIKNLALDIDDKVLNETFSVFGEILSSKVAVDASGKSRGFGFVQYKTKDAADDAILSMNGTDLGDSKLYVGAHLAKDQREAKVQEKKNQFTNVYFKNISSEATEEEVKKLFTDIGEITSFNMVKPANPALKSHGFCDFGIHETAAKAVESLNETEFKDSVIYVGRAQKKHERLAELQKSYEAAAKERAEKYKGSNLYVKNLPKSLKEDKLAELFKPFGEIVSVKIANSNDGISRGFGFVCYAEPEDAAKAVTALNGHVLEEKALYVGLAQKKDERHQILSREFQQKVNRFPNMGVVPPHGVPMGAPFGQGIPPQMMYPNMYPGQFPNRFQQMPMRGFPMPPNGQPQQFPPQFKTELGHRWFPAVKNAVNGNDEAANRVTNMLLDLPENRLNAIINDEEAFNQELSGAVEALQAQQ